MLPYQRFRKRMDIGGKITSPGILKMKSPSFLFLEIGEMKAQNSPSHTYFYISSGAKEGLILEVARAPHILLSFFLPQEGRGV